MYRLDLDLTSDVPAATALERGRRKGCPQAGCAGSRGEMPSDFVMGTILGSEVVPINFMGTDLGSETVALNFRGTISAPRGGAIKSRATIFGPEVVPINFMACVSEAEIVPINFRETISAVETVVLSSRETVSPSRTLARIVDEAIGANSRRHTPRFDGFRVQNRSNKPCGLPARAEIPPSKPGAAVPAFVSVVADLVMVVAGRLSLVASPFRPPTKARALRFAVWGRR